jgi:hypothetical protein
MGGKWATAMDGIPFGGKVEKRERIPDEKTHTHSALKGTHVNSFGEKKILPATPRTLFCACCCVQDNIRHGREKKRSL